MLHRLHHFLILSEEAGNMIGALRRLQLELANQFLRILANKVKRHAEPFINSSIQQTIRKNKKENHRHQRNAQEGDHHFYFEARTQLLLLAFKIELNQNAQQDQGKDDEGQKNKRGKNYQQDRLFRINGADEIQIQ